VLLVPFQCEDGAPLQVKLTGSTATDMAGGCDTHLERDINNIYPPERPTQGSVSVESVPGSPDIDQGFGTTGLLNQVVRSPRSLWTVPLCSAQGKAYISTAIVPPLGSIHLGVPRQLWSSSTEQTLLEPNGAESP
jgi:hypothetical protein